MVYVHMWSDVVYVLLLKFSSILPTLLVRLAGVAITSLLTWSQYSQHHKERSQIVIVCHLVAIGVFQRLRCWPKFPGPKCPSVVVLSTEPIVDLFYVFAEWFIDRTDSHKYLAIGSMVLVYMPTWLGYIDGIHVTIYSSTMDPMGEKERWGRWNNQRQSWSSRIIST